MGKGKEVLLGLMGATAMSFSAWSAEPADLIFTNGAIYTVDAVRSWAQAIAIDEGKIVYVGGNQGAEAFQGDNTQVIDLRGKMLLPGFQDNHIHPVVSGIESLNCPLFETSSQDEVLAKIDECAKSSPDKDWIRGTGWLMSAFDGGLPHKDLLDAIDADRPMMFQSTDGHSVWANSKALELAGITADTPDPEGGRIERDPETGEAIGVFQEPTAMNLIFKAAPPYTEEERKEGLAFAQKLLNSFGLIGMQDAWIDTSENALYSSLNAYRDMDQSGELTLRIVGALYWDPAKGLAQIPNMETARKEFSDNRFQASAIKIFADGVVETYTAAMLEPYEDKPDVTGDLLVQQNDLSEAVTALDAKGFQVHIHAIGDKAVRTALDAFEAARKENGARDSRHHIAHVQFVNPDDVPRFRKLNVTANFQPLWAYADDYITDLTLPLVGEERAKQIYPIASILRDGGAVSFGSDWYVSSANPLMGIETAITRRDATGEVDAEAFLPEERISLKDAIASYTINAAYVNFLDDVSGSIEVGKYADLIVLDQNLFDIAPEEISEVQVLLTLLEGKTVHGDLDQLEQ